MTRSDPLFRVRYLGVLYALAVAACSQPSVATAKLVASEQTHFTVVGRLTAPVVRYAIDATGAPVSEQQLLDACLSASTVWNKTGLADVQLAQSATPNLVISFQRDVHGPCTPFGRSAVLAHTGPCGANNYLHLDGERDWISDPRLLDRVLAHELGHALGLGHSLDPVALMHTEDHPLRVSPQASDIAGLHSLYGGGIDSYDDLAIVASDCQGQGQRITVLRGIAAVGITDAACFDTQGDGALELLVWRTDDAGQGALTVYSIDKDLALNETFGPLYGLCPPGANIRFGETTDGERLLVRVQADGSAHALRFDSRGRLQQRTQAAFDLDDLSDLDGDGELDQPLVPDLDRAPCLFAADFNQDGKIESVVRLSGSLAR